MKNEQIKKNDETMGCKVSAAKEIKGIMNDNYVSDAMSDAMSDAISDVRCAVSVTAVCISG